MQPSDSALLDLPPETLLQRVAAAGLRGRGGAHFPTADKWRAVRCEPGARVLVANGHEGEPGSIKDRYVMARRADALLLGIALAARAVGAQEAIVFLKRSFAELGRGVEAASRHIGELGVPVRIVLGDDAYVAGEETAILESLEGRRAWPRPKPPYPAALGLRGQPTLVQNVETLACVPAAVRDPEAFRREPRQLVSLWGDVLKPGVYEVRSGTGLLRIVEECGGGAPDGVSLVFPAGPSAAPLTRDRADTPLDPEALRAAGSGLGTAAILVVGRGADPRSVLSSLAAFFERESCGQCPPCSVGTQTLHRIVRGLEAGELRGSELAGLRDAAGFMADHGYCAHSRTAALSVSGVLERALAATAPGRKSRPFDRDSPERAAIERVAAGFALPALA
jgi:NADH-quinone oxidoreductase subunit F